MGLLAALRYTAAMPNTLPTPERLDLPSLTDAELALKIKELRLLLDLFIEVRNRRMEQKHHQTLADLSD